MQIPIQVDYGIRALVDLAAHADEGSVRAAEIAKRQSIPEQYLARVLHMLQRHGLTRSQRGPSGGHSLAMDASEITMGTVMRHLGGTQAIVGCMVSDGGCDQSPSCGQQAVWREVERAIQAVLEATSIADLAGGAPHGRDPSRRATPASLTSTVAVR